ncbi:alcohol dehydrogenase [Leifsonia xyli subsp. cynodontis DSM 46306]|jgi:phosphonatase-like hydrolase|uniref:Haloacid dehalogenase n=1 Tax=Leifsonia xyli subsp. cynodontis DSM 46306 TaxID=1389489 RepID=U3PCW3_LEIXC|nr:HAD family hydrolase [Leifsonia xyli]AGW42612.1 alcohol dehydrogenase [Leifsonia xyli subsp. cynodontis DSM 46306]
MTPDGLITSEFDDAATIDDETDDLDVDDLQLVVLDLAGTTVVDGALVERAFERAAEAAGIAGSAADSARARAFVRETMGQPTISVFRVLTVDEYQAQHANAVFGSAYVELAAEEGLRPVPGAEELIRRLRAIGVKVALITGFSRATKDAVLDALGWRDLADFALSPAEAGRGCPSPDPKRREAALAFGAVAVADPGVSAEGLGGSLAAFVKAGGRGAAPTIALEFTGAPFALRSLFGMLDVGGILVLVGSVGPAGPSAERPLLPEQLARRLLTVRGVHDYAPHHLEQAVRFLAGEGRGYPFEELVGAVFPLAEVDAALACSEYPRVAVRP